MLKWLESEIRLKAILLKPLQGNMLRVVTEDRKEHKRTMALKLKEEVRKQWEARRGTVWSKLVSGGREDPGEERALAWVVEEGEGRVQAIQATMSQQEQAAGSKKTIGVQVEGRRSAGSMLDSLN